jgi:hypothetical protein
MPIAHELDDKWKRFKERKHGRLLFDQCVDQLVKSRKKK